MINILLHLGDKMKKEKNVGFVAEQKKNLKRYLINFLGQKVIK